MKKYQFKKGAHIRVNADVAGQVCEQLEQTVGLTAKNLVDASRNKDAPLHSAFEWRDDIAAEAYREQQARHIINCLCLRRENGEEQPVRMFFKTTDVVYESLPVILKNEDKHATLLRNALRELSWFKQKYQQLTELQPLFEVIEQMGVMKNAG